MRTILATVVGAALFFTAACGSSKGGTSSSGSGGSTTTGGNGSGTGDPGSPCNTDSQCNSDICGGTFCCAAACPSQQGTDICTRSNGCNDGGACAYPPTGSTCGTTCGEDGTQLIAETCADDHVCHGGNATDCSPYTCTGSTTCFSNCTGDGGQCAPSYYCLNNQCVAQNNVGACTSGAQCSSGVCGANNNCCSVACPPSVNDTKDCNAQGCMPDSGACMYPTGHACVAEGITHLCQGDNTILGGACNFTGVCEMDAGICPNNFACTEDQSACGGPTCRVAADCATGFFCKGSICIPQQADGGCSEDDQCLSGACGTTGKGNCCAVGCRGVDDAGVCGAPDCDGTSGACNYPGTSVTCGPASNCVVATEMGQGPTVCNGNGGCPVPPIVACAPYVCDGTTGCYASCTDNTSCSNPPTNICDPTAGKCCGGFGAINPTISVDSTKGTDGACCGLPGAQGALKSCATISYAMKLVDAAQVKNATITATVGGGGGDWAPAGEVYPIVLGWGVDLNAQSVAFLDPKAAGAEIFDIKAYSANDTLAYASIDGRGGHPVIIGYNALNTVQTTDPSTILVEKGATLYLASANINGNATQKTTAISIQGGGTLSVGTNATANTNRLQGTVTVGTLVGLATDGWNGIVCAAGTSTSPCTITDGTLQGVPSLSVFNQENIDLEADDYASVTLTSQPQFGQLPRQAGFTKCAAKTDGKGGTGYGLLLDGAATVSLKGATIACNASTGIYLESTPNGSPSLTLDTTTVENTELGLYAGAGMATITGSTFQFNYNGVELAGSGSVNLDDATTGNTVICDSNKESANQGTAPGVGVLNITTSTLDASNTSWDTTGPDVFTCGYPVSGTNCSCVGTCTQTAGKDDMDAVNTSTGSITVTNGTQSAVATANTCG